MKSEDPDPQETAEWQAAFASVLAASGPDRARFLLDQLSAIARTPAVGWEPPRGTPYANSIPAGLGRNLLVRETRNVSSLRRVLNRNGTNVSTRINVE